MTWEEILKIDSVEKGWMDRLKGKPKQSNPIVKDNITFQDQKALDMYNQNIGQYPTIKSALAGKTVNVSAVESAMDNAGILQRNSQNQKARQDYVRATNSQRTNIPDESVWRRPAY